MTDTPEKSRSDRVEQLAEYLCSEFDFSLDPCVGYSWPEYPNDDGYRGDGNWVKLQPSDVQAYARENAARILAFLAASKPVAEAVKVKPEPAIDELAYRFWSIHPSELDDWVKTAPPMPHGYRGGVRAWFYACQMRSLIASKPEEMA